MSQAESNIELLKNEFEEMINQEFKEFSKGVPKYLMREHVFPDGSKEQQWGPFVYGYSMTIGPDGKPKIEEFGNVKSRPRLGGPALSVSEEREPLVDVISNGDVKVIVELPGVTKEDIKLRGTEQTLSISVDAPNRKYHKEIELPVPVDIKTGKTTYKNGVLEATFQKKRQEKAKGDSIKIE
jgi:HSP20 family protein